MPVLVTIVQEPGGDVTVDFQTSNKERVVVVDLRAVRHAQFPDDVLGQLNAVRSLPAKMPWRNSLIVLLQNELERCKERFEQRLQRKGAIQDELSFPHAG